MKDDERKDVKSTIFQYEKVMCVIEKNRNQLEKTIDPDYMNMLQNPQDLFQEQHLLH